MSHVRMNYHNLNHNGRLDQQRTRLLVQKSMKIRLGRCGRKKFQERRKKRYGALEELMIGRTRLVHEEREHDTRKQLVHDMNCTLVSQVPKRDTRELRERRWLVYGMMTMLELMQ